MLHVCLASAVGQCAEFTNLGRFRNFEEQAVHCSRAWIANETGPVGFRMENQIDGCRMVIHVDAGQPSSRNERMGMKLTARFLATAHPVRGRMMSACKPAGIGQTQSLEDPK